MTHRPEPDQPDGEPRVDLERDREVPAVVPLIDHTALDGGGDSPVEWP